jgi:protoporphyrinogen oxidase
VVKPREFVIVGGGPAGLSAALELLRHGVRPHVIERSNQVGGLARTEVYRGFRFDMGGHRFFTKVPEVAALWRQILGADFLKRPRLSRIFYRRRFFRYPLQVLDTLQQLGPFEAVRILASYARARILPRRPETTFEDWVSNRFGRRLFKTFFESYTEKVWGVSCTELQAEWAAQRIKQLSIATLLRQMLTRRGRTITSLIEEFHYPRLGPGMMWERAAEMIRGGGGCVDVGTSVVAVHHDSGRVTAVRTRSETGEERTIPGTDFIVSMPISDFVACLTPPPASEIREAASSLRYRDFLTVCLVVARRDLFPDNWIYVHEPGVRVARIQNFKNWSPDMAPDSEKTSLGLEYFCLEGDALWNLSDADLLTLARKEIEAIGLARGGEVEDGCVFRVRQAYPLYDAACARHVAVLRDFVNGLPNCQLVGRNGLHRYNNQDHSMMTGLLAARNSLFGRTFDLWTVNTDDEYHESQSERTESVDTRV